MIELNVIIVKMNYFELPEHISWKKLKICMEGSIYIVCKPFFFFGSARKEKGEATTQVISVRLKRKTTIFFGATGYKEQKGIPN